MLARRRRMCGDKRWPGRPAATTANGPANPGRPRRRGSSSRSLTNPKRGTGGPPPWAASELSYRAPNRARIWPPGRDGVASPGWPPPKGTPARLWTKSSWQASGPDRGDKLAARMANATYAYERERYQDARRIFCGRWRTRYRGRSAVRELYGLVFYRSGQWAQAARQLEAYRGACSGSFDQHPVLADLLSGPAPMGRRRGHLERASRGLAERRSGGRGPDRGGRRPRRSGRSGGRDRHPDPYRPAHRSGARNGTCASGTPSPTFTNGPGDLPRARPFTRVAAT